MAQTHFASLSNMSISQLVLEQMADFTCTAYAAYSVVSQNHWDHYHNKSIPIITPVEAILGLQPTLQNVVPIFAYEALALEDHETVRKTASDRRILDSKEAMREIVAEYPCGFDVQDGYPGGYQLFGFSATAPAAEGLEAKNVVALRGTVTDTEAILTLYGWNYEPVPASMPTGHSSKFSIGNIHDSYWNFYSDWGKTPLSQSFKDAVTIVASAKPELPFYGAGHSLGGGMLALGMLDSKMSGVFESSQFPPQMTTFGSVVVGDDVWAATYTNITGGVQNTLRVANEADMVPSIRGLTPGPEVGNYTHVGVPLLFVWQKNGMWDNHSLQNVYQPTVSSPSLYKKIYVAVEQVPYPVSILVPGDKSGIIGGTKVEL